MTGGPSGDVIQSMELWDETNQVWDLVDVRPATAGDSVVVAMATGDLTRYVHPLTDEIIARVKWESQSFSGSPFNWSIDMDQIVWLIE